MHRCSRMFSALAALLLVLPLGARAGGYVEGPDLSNDRFVPTVIALDPGSNTVQGTMGYSPAAVLDRDFFTIVVPAGFQLDQLVLGLGSQPGGFASFIGMQAGTTLTVDPDHASGSALLGWHLYASADRGTDILDDMGAGPDKIGFSGALPAGAYTFWIQELTPPSPGEPFPPFPFELDFRVGPVPEPATGLTLLAGLAVLGGLQRTRRYIDLNRCT